jgi:dsRNA-specific ribonuclease
MVEQMRGHLHEHNPKGQLQQVMLRRDSRLPRYRLLKQGGQSNEREYTVGVYVGDRLLATGMASSIKEASRSAAREALRLAVEVEPSTEEPTLPASELPGN